MSPISPNLMAKIARRLEANDRALAHCPRHHFERKLLYGPVHPARWVCRSCGGIVDEGAYRWYARGRADLLVELAQARTSEFPTEPPPHG